MELIQLDDIARGERAHVKRGGKMIKCGTQGMPTLRRWEKEVSGVTGKHGKKVFWKRR